MAFRSRPIKFSLLQATHLQSRICRSHVERRASDHEQSLPLGLAECSTVKLLSTDRKRVGHQFENSPADKECAAIAVSFCCRDIRRQHDNVSHCDIHSKGKCYLDSVVDLRKTAHHISPDNYYKPNNKSGYGQCVYTNDDILSSKQGINVRSGLLGVDPVTARDFWKCTPTASVQCEKVHDTDHSTTLSASKCNLSTDHVASTKNQSNLSGNISADSSAASDLMGFMEYFMNGAFALEKNETVQISSRTFISHENIDARLELKGAISEIPGVVYYADAVEDANVARKPQPDLNGPSLDKLEALKDYLAENVPQILVKRHDYSIYTNDFIFENNYLATPYVTHGVNAYGLQIAKLRVMAHFRFANVRIHTLKITVHEDSGSVCVRWRLSGIPQSRAFMFWKFLPWRYKEKINTESKWHDGLSTFYLNKTGLVTKHKMDIVMPDEEVVQKDSIVRAPLTPGLMT